LLIFGRRPPRVRRLAALPFSTALTTEPAVWAVAWPLRMSD
jgi:hypothetical protein